MKRIFTILLLLGIYSSITAGVPVVHTDPNVPTASAAITQGIAWPWPWPDLSLKGIGDNSVVPGLTGDVNGQKVSNVIKNAWMSLKHPTIWDATHCVQVPYFKNAIQRMKNAPKPKSKKPEPPCVPTAGWYMNTKGTGVCEEITVPCSGLATLNFFKDQAECQKFCISKKTGIGRKEIETTKNLDPRIVCTEQPIKSMGSSTKLKIYWSYDANTQTCWKYKIPEDSKVSFNAYKNGAVCQHFCHDVAPPGSGLGHSLATGDMSMGHGGMSMSMGHVDPPGAHVDLPGAHADESMGMATMTPTTATAPTTGSIIRKPSSMTTTTSTTDMSTGATTKTMKTTSTMTTPSSTTKTAKITSITTSPTGKSTTAAKVTATVSTNKVGSKVSSITVTKTGKTAGTVMATSSS